MSRASLILLAVLLSTGTVEAEPSCSVYDIESAGYESLVAWQADTEARWLELGSDLLVCGATETLAATNDRFPLSVATSFTAPDLILVRGYRQLTDSSTEVVARGGRHAVVARTSADLYTDLPLGHGHTEWFEVPWNEVVVRLGSNLASGTQRGAYNPAIDALVGAIDGDRWFADVETLAGWDRKSTRPGIVVARDWLFDQFDALPGLSVELDEFSFSTYTVHNVIATLVGTTRADEWYIVGGHYDSTGGGFSPGAEDNATGCAGVLEMARVFSAAPPPVTLVFVCYSGEEQGLHGSYHQVDELQASGDDDHVVHMLNMDMIGYTGDSDLDCLLETEDEFASLLTPYADAAAHYTSLRIVTTLNAFGSDHVPFIQAGLPALLTIENDWSQYPHYHSSSDLPEHVTQDMGYQVLRMNVAALADMIGIQGGIFADGFESGDTTAW